jgi:hypothetical protein
MKRIGVLFFLFLALQSCEKDRLRLDDFTEVTVIGIDMTMTPCSGGYVFQIGDSTYRTIEVISNTILTDTMTFPKTVFIKYEHPNGGCYDWSERNIKITDIHD